MTVPVKRITALFFQFSTKCISYYNYVKQKMQLSQKETFWFSWACWCFSLNQLFIHLKNDSQFHAKCKTLNTRTCTDNIFQATDCLSRPVKAHHFQIFDPHTNLQLFLCSQQRWPKINAPYGLFEETSFNNKALISYKHTTPPPSLRAVWAQADVYAAACLDVKTEQQKMSPAGNMIINTACGHDIL